MNGTLFYIFGILLVISAVAVALVGLRFESFPPTRIVLFAVVAYFACLVGATTTFAVLHAADDQHARQAEEAQAAAQTTTPSATTAGSTTATVPGISTSSTTSTAAPAGKGSTLKLAASASAIAYDTKQLNSKAGEVTIDFNNPSALTHDVCIEGPTGQQIGCSDQIAQSATTLSENLKAGKYVFFCSVDSHRQSGMEGTLTVK